MIRTATPRLMPIKEKIDITLPERSFVRGKIHPVSQTIDEISSIFSEIGFNVEEGPDVENEYNNFTALNTPDNHPARDMHDTFYLDEKKYLNVILDRYSEDDKELLKLRTQFLDSILEKGIEEVKNFVINLSKSLKSKINDDMKSAYLALFKEVIMLDKNVHDNERILYRLLCEQWDQKSDI